MGARMTEVRPGHFLPARFPDLFPERWARELPWVFECGEGWREILEDLCVELQALAEQAGRPIRVQSVREKMGRLQVSVSSRRPEVLRTVRRAEEVASRTCEGCGNPSRIRTLSDWTTTACNSCLRDLNLLEELS